MCGLIIFFSVTNVDHDYYYYYFLCRENNYQRDNNRVLSNNLEKVLNDLIDIHSKLQQLVD